MLTDYIQTFIINQGRKIKIDLGAVELEVHINALPAYELIGFMSTKTILEASSRIGMCKVGYRGLDQDKFTEIQKFSDNLDSRVGSLFEIEMNAVLSVSDDLKHAEKMFSVGEKCDYRGLDKPMGWDLRSTDGSYTFYAPKRDSYIEVKRDSGSMEVNLYSRENDLGMLRHGIIDLLQLGTSKLLVHSVAIEKEGKGILFVGNSGSGKTTLHTQLINVGYKFNLVTEGYSLISDGSIFQVKTAGLLRNGALKYLGLPSSSGLDVDFKDYTGTKTSVAKVDLVVAPSFNLNGEYYTVDTPVSIKPIYRDWPMQVYGRAERDVLITKKMEQVGMLPKRGIMFRYSTDAEKTAALFNDMLGELRC